MMVKMAKVRNTIAATPAISVPGTLLSLLAFSHFLPVKYDVWLDAHLQAAKTL